MAVPRLSRRSLVLGAVVGLNASLAGSGVQSTTPASLSPAAVRDLVAVRVFPTYRGKVYGEHDAVLARLRALGIKRISHKLTPAMDPSVIEFTQRAYRELAIKSWFTVGEPRAPLSMDQWDDIEALLSGPLAGMVERCYGWNEPNHRRGGGSVPDDWPLQTAAHQAQLWTRVKPLDIKIGTPQLWSGSFRAHDADLATLAPLIKGNFDHIGWHLYPRGDVGIALLEQFEATYRRLLGDFPIVCTEAGYLDAVNYTGGAVSLSPTEKADLLPELVDAYTSRGYGFSYFELLDDPDPSASGREAGLGLVECVEVDPTTWRNKPAFYAFQSCLAGT